MDHARIPSGLWCYRFGKDKLLLGGALIDGGSMYQWVKDSFRASDKELQKLEGMLPNQHGLTILPFLSGKDFWAYNPALVLSQTF
jgi:gluconokinase